MAELAQAESPTGGSAPDAQLVTQALAGSRSAFGELYRRHHRAVNTAARQWVDEPEQRLDVVQESFTRALQNLPSLSDPARFRSWVLQIARNASIDHLRRRRNFDPDSLDELETLPPSPDVGPDVLAEVNDLAHQIVAGIASLSPRDATALALSAHFGFGPAEIGAALGVTPNNAKVILHRARRRLRAATSLLADG